MVRGEADAAAVLLPSQSDPSAAQLFAHAAAQTLLSKRDPKLGKHILKEQLDFQGFDAKEMKELPQQTPVSYTHLTLPTIRLV